MSRARIGALEEFPEAQGARVDVDGRSLVVVRIGEQVYALADTCSHEDASLSEGDVSPEDLEIECPLHGSAFRLDTGEALSLPATHPVAAYTVTVEDGEVWVEW